MGYGCIYVGHMYLDLKNCVLFFSNNFWPSDGVTRVTLHISCPPVYRAAVTTQKKHNSSGITNTKKPPMAGNSGKVELQAFRWEAQIKNGDLWISGSQPKDSPVLLILDESFARLVGIFRAAGRESLGVVSFFFFLKESHLFFVLVFFSRTFGVWNFGEPRREAGRLLPLIVPLASSTLALCSCFQVEGVFGSCVFHSRCETWWTYGCFQKYGKPPKSSILIGFSIINHPFWGTHIFGNIQMKKNIKHT